MARPQRQNSQRHPTEPRKTPGTSASILAASAFLLGGLCVWSIIAPMDATSVFLGEAQPQNLLGLLIATLAATAVWLSKPPGLLSAESSRQWPWAVAALIWLIVCTALAGRENNPRTAWYGFWQVVMLAGCYYSVRAVASPRTGATRGVLVAILLTGCIACAIHGVQQVLVGFPQDRAAYEADPEGVLQASGIYAPPGTPERMRFEDRLRSPEPFATYALANSLACVLSMALVLLLACGLNLLDGMPLDSSPRFGLSSSAQRRFAIAGCLVAIALVGFTWFLTRSRTAYVAVALSLIYWWVLVRLGRRKAPVQGRVLWAGGAVLLLAAVGGLWLLQNDRFVFSESLKSLSFRLDYWNATTKLLQEHWLFGIGLGNFQAYYPKFMVERASETIADPHNWWLDIAVTLSLPIALLITAWLSRHLLLGFRQSEERDARSDKGASHDTSTADDSPHAASPIDDTSLGRALLAGAVVGGTACVGMLALLQRIDAAIVLGGWFLATILSVGLWPIIRGLVARNDAALSAAIFACLVCLLASGSWQATGVALPLLVLLAILAGSSSRSGFFPSDSAASGPKASLGHLAPRSSKVPLVLAPLGLLIFIMQSWLPVNASWRASQESLQARSRAEALRELAKAADADPLDRSLGQAQADLEVLLAKESPPGVFERRAEAALETLTTWLAADSTSYRNWEFAGDRALELAAKALSLGLRDTAQKFVKRAESMYKVASQRYPVSARLHLQLATVQALLGRVEAAKTELQEAERLSAATPHADKQLENQQIWLPIQLAATIERAEAPDGASFPQNSGSDLLPAKPLADWIRKLE